MARKRIPQGLRVWIDARKRFHLSHAQVQMARELGMNPKTLGKLDNHRQQPWKLPLTQFIAHLYSKRFGKPQPDVVVSIEERARQMERKKALRREAKRLRREATAAAPPVGGGPAPPTGPSARASDGSQAEPVPAGQAPGEAGPSLEPRTTDPRSESDGESNREAPRQRLTSAGRREAWPRRPRRRRKAAA